MTAQISDDGPGLPACVQSCLFRSQAKQSRPTRHGCGLAIARELAERNGGKQHDRFHAVELVPELGWKLGSNIELEYRWPGAELDQVSIAANEIVAMRPDLVVSRTTPTTAIMMNRGLPIVFVLVTDPLFSGFVQSLRSPGGSVTGFSLFESSVGGKWLALLKEAAPAVSRVSLLFNPETAPFAEGYRQSMEAAAPTLGITVVSAPCGNAAHIENVFEARAREGSGGIIYASQRRKRWIFYCAEGSR